MITIYWAYRGYIGDKFSGDIAKKTAAEFAPNSRSVGFKIFSWLTQKGFGPGYFNNSGVYVAFCKSVFKTEADKNAALSIMTQSFHSYTHTIFADEVTYYDAVKEARVTEKRMRKQNPY